MAKGKNPFLRKFGVVSRGTNAEWHAQFNTRERGVILHRPHEYTLTEIWNVVNGCTPLRKALQTLKDYIFKEGWEWEKDYSKKCTDCGFEHPETEKPVFCANCGSRALVEPDAEFVRNAEKWFDRMDRNGHGFKEVLKMFEEYLNRADDAYLVIIKDYTKVDKKGRPLEWHIRDVYVGDPRNFKKVIDPNAQTPGGKFWGCLVHRPRPEYARDTRDEYGDQGWGRAYGVPGHCDECDRPLQPIWYVNTEAGSTEDPIEYYFGDIELPDGTYAQEVIHTSKYNPSYGYGESPVLTILRLARTLINQEEYVDSFYDEERVPRKALVVMTNNPGSFRSAMKAAEDKNVSQRGHHIPKFTVAPTQHGPANPIQMLDWTSMPAELQMVENRREYYTFIGSAYGVTPIFLGINDAAGLQSQGPTQWRVTEDAAKLGQDVYNDKVFPRFLQQMKKDPRFCMGGWKLILAEVAQKDEMIEWQVKMAEAGYAQQLSMMGFRILGLDAEGHFEFTDRPDPTGGMGGMMGGMGGMGMGGGMGMPAGAPGMPSLQESGLEDGFDEGGPSEPAR